MKPHRGDGSFISGSSIRGEFGLDVAFAENNRSEQSVVDKKDAGTLSERSSSTHCRNPNSDSNTDLTSSRILNAKASNSSSTDDEEMVAAMWTNNFSGRKDVLQAHGEIKQGDIQSGDDRKRTVLRLDSTIPVCS